MKSEYINPICKTCGKPIPLNRPRDRFKQFCNTKCATFMIYSESVEYIKSLNLIFSNAGILTHINNKNRVLSISKKSEINKIFHYLYDNNYDFLDRKKDKFIKILTLFNHT